MVGVNPFSSTARRLALIGAAPAAALFAAVLTYLAPVVAEMPPVVHESVPTAEERAQGQCAALLAKQPSQAIAALAAAQAAERGCTR